MNLNDQDRALWEAAEAATPGPWAVRDFTYAVHQPELQCWIPQDINDARYIALANPEAIKALLTRLDTAVAALEDIEPLADHAHSCLPGRINAAFSAQPPEELPCTCGLQQKRERAVAALAAVKGGPQ